MACPNCVIPWIVRRCHGYSSQPVCLQRFDEEENFSVHHVIQIRVVGQGTVAAASVMRMSRTKPSSSELWEMKSFSMFALPEVLSIDDSKASLTSLKH